MSFNNVDKNEQVGAQRKLSCSDTQITMEDVDRLAKDAGKVIAMFEHVCPDKLERLKMASALAGYACHQAVKENGEKFVNVETEDGLEFYFGSALNYYLLDSSFSVMGFMKGFYVNKATEPKELDIDTPIKQSASNVGNREYLIWGQHVPAILYEQTRECWLGIYQNMTSKYCKNPSEWPVLYGIVLQNIMFQFDMDAEETFFKALECALYISKMGSKSIKNDDLDEAGNDFLYNFYQDGKLVEIAEGDKTFLKNSIDVLRGFLKENNLSFEVSTSGTEAKVISFKMMINNVMTNVYVAIYIQPRMCRMEFKIPFMIDTSRATDMCMKIMKYNYSRRFGSFQYDESDGDLCYRTAFPCSDGLKIDDYLATFLCSVNSVGKFMDRLREFEV